ncbi:hypothetical protein JC2156_05500 [Weissella koreensis KCTC 3621]|uniref:YfbU family protein n=1 Tax=Weissella koreensis TaxID=165096 RepID=UPI00026F3EE0|nr:YfbU family protein [Weissella koreensis]EJF33736.1 hypothetical protein JC2156_05500 [Weissella koreensis KCTC 3621]
MVEEFKLNFTEEQRVLLVNQFEILAKLAKLDGEHDESKSYENASFAVQMGYSYDWAFENTHLQSLGKTHITENDQKYVIDVMNMYNYIYGVYNELNEEDKKKIPKSELEFKGFDGHEPAYGFYKFITDDLERFKTVTEFVESNHWDEDSHGFNGNLNDMVERYLKIMDNHIENESKFQNLKNVLGIKD